MSKRILPALFLISIKVKLQCTVMNTFAIIISRLSMGSLDKNVSFYGRSPNHCENSFNTFFFLEGDPCPCGNTSCYLLFSPMSNSE